MSIDFKDLERQIKERGEIIELDNGATIIFEHIPNSGLSWGLHTIFAGSAYEKKEDAGIMHFLEHMVFGDSKKYPDEYERMLTQNVLGVNINAITNHLMTRFPIAGENQTNYLLQDNFLDAFDIVTDCVFLPKLSQNSFERELEIVEREIALAKGREASDIYAKVVKKINNKIYSANNFILENVLGTKKSINSINREKLKEYHSKFYVGKNLLFGAVGDINNNGFRKSIISEIEKLPTGKEAPPMDLIEQSSYEGRDTYKVEITAPKDAIVELYFKIPSDDSLEGIEAPFVSKILGGNLNSILSQEMRFKQNLVYSVGSSLNQNGKTNVLKIQYSVDEKNIDFSLDLVEKSLDRLKKGNFDDSLVNACKSSYLPQALYSVQVPGWIHNELSERYSKMRFGDELTGLERFKKSLTTSKQDIIDFGNKYLNDKYISIVKHIQK